MIKANWRKKEAQMQLDGGTSERGEKRRKTRRRKRRRRREDAVGRRD